MESKPSLMRPLLYSLVGSVIVGAVLGISAVLRNTWGWFEVRVVLTTGVIAAGSVCGLACGLSRTPRGRNLLPRAGLLLSLVAAGQALLGIWTNLDSVAYWKTNAVVTFFTIATVHLCLLSIARLSSRFRWVFHIASQAIFGLAMLLSVLVIFEVSDAGMFRLAAAIAIVNAALTLVIPLLHRISRSDPNSIDLATPLEQRNTAAIDDEITRLTKRIAELERLKLNLQGDGQQGSA